MATIAQPVQAQWDDEVLVEEHVSNARLVFRRLRRHKLAMFGIVVLAFFLAISFGASFLAPYDFDSIDLLNTFAFPGSDHILGTDSLGRDILTRLMYAGRISLTVALISSLLSASIGTLYGATAGFLGGRIENIMMRFVDIMLTLPVLPMLLILSTSLREFRQLQDLFGPLLSMAIIILVIVGFGWMGVARLVYGQVLSLRGREFMEAGRALGGSNWRLITQHLIPNSLAPIIVSATLGFSGTIVYEATLSFLGFGVSPPIPSWGNMLTDVQRFIMRDPLLAVYPGMCIFLTVLSINFLGDGLRDALDPRLKI